MLSKPWLAIAMSLPAMLFAAMNARAGDGQLEINQASVLAAGGYPLVITQEGSYRLTSNLVVATDANAIEATVTGVRIDLGGFSVIGPGSCTPTFVGNLLENLVCTGNTGFGIGIEGAEEVRNGGVRGFATGILGRSNGYLRLDGVSVTDSSGSGVSVTGPTIITDSRFERNGSTGVSGQNASAGITASNSIFRQNRVYGLYLGSGTLDRSVVEQNGSQGVRSNVGRGSVITNTFFGRNPVGAVGNNMGIAHCTFDENTADFSATQLGPNLCDNSLCP